MQDPRIHQDDAMASVTRMPPTTIMRYSMRGESWFGELNTY